MKLITRTLCGLAATCVSLIAAAPTQAQTVENNLVTADSANLSLEILDQTVVVDSGVFTVDFELKNLGDKPNLAANNLSELELDTKIFGAISDRDQLRTNQSSRQVLHNTETVFLNQIVLEDEPDSKTVFRFELRFRGNGDSPNSEELFIPGPGTYPITFDIELDGETLTSATSFFVTPETSDDGIDKYPIAILMPVGENRLSTADAIELLETHQNVELTLIVDADTVSEIGQSDTLRVELLDALGKRAVMFVPDSPADISALANVGLAQLELDYIKNHNGRLTEFGFTTISNVTFSNGPLTSQGMDQISEQSTIVVDISSDAAASGLVSSTETANKATYLHYEQNTAALTTPSALAAAEIAGMLISQATPNIVGYNFFDKQTCRAADRTRTQDLECRFAAHLTGIVRPVRLFARNCAA